LDNTTSDPLIGRAISQYEVVARIGGGGMGVVYKATDQKLGRTVALKFLPPQWSHDEGAKQRFLREAQAASATNHRNICIIHDIAQTGDGQLFIVMAYYEGQTLKQTLEAGPLPVAEALEIAAEIAEGLAKAHAQGVVHRDVKPGNLMITDDGVKVLDFGLAKFADSLQLTMAGSTVGTVAYMSPEQARGEEADARSDVWALGVVLYEMLTGRVPFKGAYPEATFHAIKNEPVPPPSAPGREIPAAVEMLVLRALEKDPERRYQTAREVARDIRLLQGRTVPLDLRTEQLPPLPFLQGPETLSWRQRVRRAVTPGGAIAAVVAMAVAVAGTYAWLTRPVVRIPVAIAPLANHTGEAELDAYQMALTQSLVDEISDSPNLRVVPYPRLLEIVRRFIGAKDRDVSSSEAIQAIATQSGASFVIIPSLEYRNGMWLARAQVRSVEAGTVTNTYETEALASSLPKDTALRQLPLLAEKIQAHFRANGPGRSYASRPVSARFRNLDALRAFEEGLNAYAELEYSSALAAFRRAAAADDQDAMAQAWLSRVLLLLSQRDEAVAAAKKAKQLATSDTPQTDAALIEATLAETQSDAVAAEQRFRAMVVHRPDEMVAKIELADFLKRQSQNQPAIAAYQEALRLDGRYDRLRVDLCQLYVRLDDYPLAEQQANKALEGFRAAGHRGGEAQALLCLGDAERSQGAEARLADARHNIESARTIFESLGYEYGLSRVYQYLGLVAAGERNYRVAANFFEQALARSRTVGNRVIEGSALINLGVALEALGQRAEVLKYYEEARDFFRRTGDEQRAAEQEANAAALLIDYGADQEGARRRIVNARGTFEKLGNIEFQVLTVEFEAASDFHAGLHDEARRRLRAALSLAKDRQLDRRFVYGSIRLAESYFATSEYETARTLLEQTAAMAVGRDELAVPIALGRVYERLGDFESARKHLEPALAAVDTSGQLWLAPVAHLALGELEFESGNGRAARAHFDKAAAYWTDDWPDVASVEARCYREALDPNVAAASVKIAASVERARKMGRLFSEAQCQIQQARVHLSRRQYAEALATLGGIPLGGDRTVGKETQALVHYWRGRALAAQGDRTGDAGAEATEARSLMNELQASLPPDYRNRFAARSEVQQVFENVRR
jgi:tetratricopeptide (TPR) repeat protein